MTPSRGESHVPQRSLFIQILLAGFVAIVVFVISSFVFLIPKMLEQDLRQRDLSAQIEQVRLEIAELRAAMATARPTEPAAEAAEAPVPAPEQGR